MRRVLFFCAALAVAAWTEPTGAEDGGDVAMRRGLARIVADATLTKSQFLQMQTMAYMGLMSSLPDDPDNKDLAALAKKNPDRLDKALGRAIEKTLPRQKAVEIVAAVMEAKFSTEELTKIVEFQRSEIGKKLLSLGESDEGNDALDQLGAEWVQELIRETRKEAGLREH